MHASARRRHDILPYRFFEHSPKRYAAWVGGWELCLFQSPLELLHHPKPHGLQCVFSSSHWIIRKEVDFPSFGSFDVGPGCCTLWIGPAALSCIHSNIFYASPAQFCPVAAHFEAQTVLPTRIPRTIFFQTGAFAHQSHSRLDYLFGTRICFMFILGLSKLVL